MKNIFFVLPTLFVFSFLSGCAHHKDVRPGVDGINRVLLQSEDDNAGRDALAQAEHYCKQFGKAPGIIEEKTSYTGKVDEETYNNGKAVSRVLKTVGGATHVFGGNNESNIGGVGVLAGVGTDAALGKGYTTEMKFKCQ
jgi:hypothetical protein